MKTKPWEYCHQNGDERRVNKAVQWHFRVKYYLSHRIVEFHEVTERLRARVDSGLEIGKTSPGGDVISKEEKSDQECSSGERHNVNAKRSASKVPHPCSILGGLLFGLHFFLYALVGDCHP